MPARPGIYAWYFDKPPLALALEGTPRSAGYYLLYLGVSPSNARSKGSLRSRIKGHLLGNAASSTLRLSLGSLLAAELDLRPSLFGSRRRVTFGEDEKRLDVWLEANAFVTWIEQCNPWKFEPQLIERIQPALNIDHNDASPNRAIVEASRAHQREIARGARALTRLQIVA